MKIASGGQSSVVLWHWHQWHDCDGRVLVLLIGLFFIVPCTDTYTKVDLRTVSFDVPPQEVNRRVYSLYFVIISERVDIVHIVLRDFSFFILCTLLRCWGISCSVYVCVCVCVSVSFYLCCILSLWRINRRALIQCTGHSSIKTSKYREYLLAIIAVFIRFMMTHMNTDLLECSGLPLFTYVNDLWYTLFCWFSLSLSLHVELTVCKHSICWQLC